MEDEAVTEGDRGTKGDNAISLAEWIFVGREPRLSLLISID